MEAMVSSTRGTTVQKLVEELKLPKEWLFSITRIVNTATKGEQNDTRS
jgi:hypothetical protein